MISLLWRLGDRLRGRRYPAGSGRTGEDLAHRYLRRQGCTVVARNYRPPSGSGEIDLVIWDRGKLAFVEVKSRAGEDFGPPDAAVDAEKRYRLGRAAAEYARRVNVPLADARFDTVSVVLGKKPAIEWRREAFRA